MKQTKQEKLFDVVQLAKEIFIRRAAITDYNDRSAGAHAESCFLLAEIFIKEQEKYADRSQDT